MQPLEHATPENLLLFAAKHYYKPRFADSSEFEDDLARLKYIKRLANRYIESGELCDRLILNHLIVVFNVFGIYPTLEMLGVKLSNRHWPVIKPFIIKLQAVPPEHLSGIIMDPEVVSALRKI